MGYLNPVFPLVTHPTLTVWKKDNSYRLVQGLRIINEAVVLLHTVVPSLYVLLGTIPADSASFTVLYLKDAIFAPCWI